MVHVSEIKLLEGGLKINSWKGQVYTICAIHLTAKDHSQ